MNNITKYMEERGRLLDQYLNRWKYLTEGIENPEMRAKVSMLLDVQAQERTPFFMEADQTTATLPTSVFPSTIAFPAIVRAYPALVANDLVQVQPMNAPRALVPYMRTVRSASGNAELTQQGSWTNTAEQGTPEKIRLRLDTLELTVQKKMLNLEWTAELEEDISAFGGYDLQAMLVQAASDEIRGQIDYEVIRDLFNAATAAAVTGTTGITTVSAGAGNVNFSFAAAGGSADSTREKQQLFLDAVIDAKALIYNASRRTANFIVGNATSIAHLEKMTSWQYNPALIKTGETYRAGTLAGQWDVYISDAAPANKLLVGVKQQGYILGLYRPLELTTTNYKNESDEYIRGVRTRTGRKLVDGHYFATITITG